MIESDPEYSLLMGLPYKVCYEHRYGRYGNTVYLSRGQYLSRFWQDRDPLPLTRIKLCNKCWLNFGMNHIAILRTISYQHTWESRNHNPLVGQGNQRMPACTLDLWHSWNDSKGHNSHPLYNVKSWIGKRTFTLHYYLTCHKVFTLEIVWTDWDTLLWLSFLWSDYHSNRNRLLSWFSYTPHYSAIIGQQGLNVVDTSAQKIWILNHLLPILLIVITSNDSLNRCRRKTCLLKVISTCAALRWTTHFDRYSPILPTFLSLLQCHLSLSRLFLWSLIASLDILLLSSPSLPELQHDQSSANPSNHGYLALDVLNHMKYTTNIRINFRRLLVFVTQSQH